MSDPIGLDGYFARIGYSGPRAATLEVLRELHARHVESIPFENLSPFLGHDVPIDVPSLEKKLIASRRGGYCFEQNALFAAALEALGFNITRLAARVLYGVPEGTITPRSHMLLRAQIGGEDYIADVGFGGLTQTAPLHLAPGEQQTSHETFRFVRTDSEYRTEVRTGDDWRPLYRFDLTPQLPIDYTAANYYVATNPASRFVNGLMLCRPFEAGRYTLSNRVLSTYRKSGDVERCELQNGAELTRVLRENFLIEPPPGVEAAFSRLA